MTTTAAALYFQAADKEFFPAAVPICNEGSDGVATVIFDIYASSAEEMVFSDSLDDRATAAIFACHAAHNTALNVIPMA